MNEVRKNVIKALENIFIFVNVENNDDVDLEHYIEDSIQFMSFIVELEEIFRIEFPADLLLFDNFKSLKQVTIIVTEIISNN